MATKRRNVKVLRARIAELKKEWEGRLYVCSHNGGWCWTEDAVLKILTELSRL